MDKETNIDLSIVIPVFRVEKYLRKCIDSFITQIRSNVEIILIDDGSDDLCPSICDEYSTLYPEIKTIHKKNEGLASAVTEGVRHAHGKYIGFCDSDDWASCDYINEILHIIELHNPDLIYFDFMRIYETTHRNSANKSFLLSSKLYQGDECEKIKKLYIKKNGIHPTRWSKVIKKELVDITIPFYNSKARIGEDILFTAPIIYKMNSLYYIDKELIYYNINTGSMTQNFDDRFIKDFDLVFSSLSDFFKDDKSFLGYINYINMRTMVNLVGKSKIKRKKRYLKNLLSDPKVKERLTWTSNNDLSKKDQLLLFFIKNNWCNSLLLITWLYNMVKK